MGHIATPLSFQTAWGNRNTRFLAFSLLAIFLLAGIWHTPLPEEYEQHRSALISHVTGRPPPPPPKYPELAKIKSKYAYITLLGVDDTRDEGNDINNDEHYVGARMLAYQLLHAEETRSEGIPYIVLAVPDVNEVKKERLRKDGAIVIDIERIPLPGWLHNENPAYDDCFNKLRVWELEQFDRICFIDADTVLARPVHGVFNDTAVVALPPRDDAEELPNNDAPWPPDYVMAAQYEMQWEHNYPPTEENGDFLWPDYFNAGFFVTKPSLAVLDFYLARMQEENLFLIGLMEQEMLNVIHKPASIVPWQQLDTKWNLHYATKQDLESGLVSLHTKWWAPDHDDMRDWLLSWRWRMEGFFESRDQAQKKHN